MKKKKPDAFDIREIRKIGTIFYSFDIFYSLFIAEDNFNYLSNFFVIINENQLN